MPRQPSKPLTDEEIYKQQLQQEQELHCLQRRYTFLERDRQLYGLRLGRLNRILGFYKREHSNILTDLSVATSPVKKRENKKDFDHLAKLLDDYDYYEAGVKKDRQNIGEIDVQIQKVEKDVIKLRMMQITDKHREERVYLAKKTVDGLMNRLCVQNQKFGTLCAKNREMKTEIRRMLWERDVFMKIWNKFVNQLVLGKQFMTDLTEQASLAYDQREQWFSKLQALRIKAHCDFVVHSQEMRELKRKQQHQKKLEEFFNIKGQKRVMKTLEMKETIKKIVREKKLKLVLKRYRKYLDDILEFTEEQRVRNIAKKFHQQECENFGLFTNITNLINEMEYLNLQLSDLQDEITKKTVMRNLTREEYVDTLNNMKAELQTSSQEVEDAKSELASIDGYINEMLSGISELFQVCECNKDPILQLLGDNTEVNIYNYLFFLEMVEKAIHKALILVYDQEKNLFDKKKIGANERIIFYNELKSDYHQSQVLTVSSPCPLCIEHEVVSDVIVSLQRVKTRSEIKQELAERLECPEYLDHVHNLSKCFLPQSRNAVQKRYQ